MIVIWVLLGAVFLGFLQERLYARYWDKNLSVSLHFQEESVTEGESCVLCEQVENAKLLPVPALKVKFQVSRYLQLTQEDGASSVTDQYYRNDVLSIRPYMRHVRKLTFFCKKRGFYRINGLDMVAGNLLLSSELPKSFSSDTQLYVYPKAFRGAEFEQAVQKLNGEILSRRHVLEDPFEYRGIREYSPYDTMRDINWKATARTGELKVNMKNYTSLKAVRIFVNLEDGAILRQMELLEASISMAAGLAELFLKQGIRTALYTNGPDVLTGEPVCLEAASGIGHMESINRGLARIELIKSAPSFVRELEDAVLERNDSMGSVFCIFLSSNAQDDFQGLLCKCLERGMELAWICPSLPGMEMKALPALERYVTVIPVNEG